MPSWLRNGNAIVDAVSSGDSLYAGFADHDAARADIHCGFLYTRLAMRRYCDANPVT